MSDLKQEPTYQQLRCNLDYMQAEHASEPATLSKLEKELQDLNLRLERLTILQKAQEIEIKQNSQMLKQSEGEVQKKMLKEKSEARETSSLSNAALIQETATSLKNKEDECIRQRERVRVVADNIDALSRIDSLYSEINSLKSITLTTVEQLSTKAEEISNNYFNLLETTDSPFTEILLYLNEEFLTSIERVIERLFTDLNFASLDTDRYASYKKYRDSFASKIKIAHDLGTLSTKYPLPSDPNIFTSIERVIGQLFTDLNFASLDTDRYNSDDEYKDSFDSKLRAANDLWALSAKYKLTTLVEIIRIAVHKAEDDIKHAIGIEVIRKDQEEEISQEFIELHIESLEAERYYSDQGYRQEFGKKLDKARILLSRSEKHLFNAQAAKISAAINNADQEISAIILANHKKEEELKAKEREIGQQFAGLSIEDLDANRYVSDSEYRKIFVGELGHARGLFSESTKHNFSTQAASMSTDIITVESKIAKSINAYYLRLKLLSGISITIVLLSAVVIAAMFAPAHMPAIISNVVTNLTPLAFYAIYGSVIGAGTVAAVTSGVGIYSLFTSNLKPNENLDLDYTNMACEL